MTRRTQFLISSFISVFSLPLLYALSSQLHIPLNTILVFWFVIATLVLVYVIERSYRFPEQLVFAVLPFLFLVTLLVVTLRFNLLAWSTFSVVWIVVYGVAGFLMYVLFLSLNIVNAATVRTVPLLKAAQTTLLVFSLVLAVFWSLYIQMSVIHVVLAGWLWFVFSYLLCLAVVYLGQVEVVREFTGVIRVPFIEAFTVAVLQAYLVLATSGWHMTGAIRTIYWVSALAVMIMLIRARRQRTLSKKMIREFTLLQWAIFIAVLIGGVRFG